METFFGSYREEPPDFERVEDLGGGFAVERRFTGKDASP